MVPPVRLLAVLRRLEPVRRSAAAGSSGSLHLQWPTRPADNQDMRPPAALATTLSRFEQARRTRLLERDPERATWPEVEEMLSRELPLRVVLDVCVRAHGRGIRPGILWSWTRTHGAPVLALAVAAGLDDTDLRHHLPGLHGLDLDSLELHAELNGYPVAVVRAHRGVAPRT